MKFAGGVWMPAVLGALLLFLAGCVGGQTAVARIMPPLEGQTASDGSPVVANLMVENRGVYLFNWLPIWSGNPNRPNLRKYHLFRDSMRPIHMRFMLETATAKAGAGRYLDQKTATEESGAFSLWLFWNRTTRSTAVAVDRLKEKEE